MKTLKIITWRSMNLKVSRKLCLCFIAISSSFKCVSCVTQILHLSLFLKKEKKNNENANKISLQFKDGRILAQLFIQYLAFLWSIQIRNH